MFAISPGHFRKFPRVCASTLSKGPAPASVCQCSPSACRTELLQRYGDGMDFAIEDMETYAHEARLPGEHLVLFLLATYGDGEPTDNALEFYNWVTAAAKGAGDGTGDEALLKVRCRREHAFLGR